MPQHTLSTGARVSSAPSCCNRGMVMRLAEGNGHEYECGSCGCGIFVANYTATKILDCSKHSR